MRRIHPTTVQAVTSADKRITLPCSARTTQVDGAHVLHVTIHNPTRRPLRLARVRLLEIDLETQRADVFRQGFRMPGDPCAFVRLQARQDAPPTPYWKPAWLGRKDLLSHTLTAFRGTRQRRSRLVGFVTHGRFESLLVYHTNRRSLRLSAWCVLEGIAIPPGKRLGLEQLMLAEHPDFNACTQAYARHCTHASAARIPATTATGWVDWQYYREEKTEADILENARALAELKRRGFPLTYIIIDGGWCAHASEWLEPCDKFPAGMKRLSARLRRMGFQLGLWFAPYITNTQTRVAREHPEWLVRNAKTGKPLLWRASNVGPCHVLDFTVPEAVAWLRGIVRTLVRDWRIGYLKLDGPALRHYEGGRFHDPNETAVTQIRRSLEAIREECGNDVLVEGEGLYGVSIGCVDIQRVQMDNFPFWYHPETGTPLVRSNLQTELLSAFLHGRLWHNHRENVIVRDTPSPYHHRKHQDPATKDPILPENELRLQIAAGVISGGAMLLSDRMVDILRNPTRVRLISQFLPHFETQGCVPIDVYAAPGAQPSLFALPIETAWESWCVVGVFNWSDGYENFSVPLTKIGCKGRWRAHEFWTQDYLGTHRDDLPIKDVPPHACRVIALRRAVARPQLIGSDLHLLQGAVEIKRSTWDGRVLRLRVGHFFQEEVSLSFHVPSSWRLQGVKTHARSWLVDDRHAPVLRLRFDGRKTTDFELRWARS